MSDRRVVITGIGILSPIGLNKEDFWKNLVAGKSGVKNITSFDTTEYATHFGGEITGYDPKPYSIETMPLRMLLIIIGMVNGETLLGCFCRSCV